MVDYLNILLCDDEEVIRNCIKDVLREISYCKVIGEAGDGQRALELFHKYRPDIIYLDVDMPKMSGIEVAKEIRKEDQCVYIIFGTRFSDYIFDSVDYYAYDYMLKPFDKNRIVKTLDRIYAIRNDNYMNDRYCIKSERNTYYVKYDDIYMLEKFGKKLFVVTKHRTYECYDSLNEIELMLSKKTNFVRVHKSYIVNFDKVKSINKKLTTNEIIFNDIDSKALLSRDKYHILRELRLI